MSSDSDGTGAGNAASSGAAPSLLAFADALLAEGRVQQEQASAEVRQLVVVTLSDRELAIPILQCREIVRLPTVTRVPEAPDFVRGVVNVRGRVVPVVDTRQCLGLPAAVPTAKARLLMVEVAGRLLALLVDRVSRIVKVPVAEIAQEASDAPLPGTAGTVRIGEMTMGVLDVDSLVRTDQVIAASPARSDEA